MNIYVKEKFLDIDDINFCIDFYDYIENNKLWLPSIIDFWDGRVYDIFNLLDDGGDRHSYSYFMKILRRIRSEVHLATGEDRIMYPDTFQITRWSPGEGLEPHADNFDLKNNTMGIAPWRLYSSIIYLNNDFDGGQTYFEPLGIEIDPQPGNLLIFSCGPEHLHGVKKINKGTRKTLSSFWSENNINKKVRL